MTSKSQSISETGSETGQPLNLLAQTPEALRQLVHDLKWPPYRTQQILRWLYRHRVRDIDQMTDLARTDRATLSRLARIQRTEEYRSLASTDGTRKLLGRLADGLVVESVLISNGNRLTLCLSTQVGCTLDCGFCLTGAMGLKRNLKSHEIVDQVLMALDHLSPDACLTNLVFMGMGEPLANLWAVAEAIERLTTPSWGPGFSPRRITISTAGLAPRLKDVAALGVNLAVSLNATTNSLRDQLMPAINRLYPLEILLEACRNYPLSPRQRVTFEYVLLAGVNDTDEDARRLVKLLAGIRSKVNLIPFNEFPGSLYRKPEDSAVLRFQSALKCAGLTAFIRKSKGADVLGACGQLGNQPAVRPSLVLTPTGGDC